jgi:hypothetical protein
MTNTEPAFQDELRRAFPPRPIDAGGAFDERGRTYPDAAKYERQMDGKTWEQLDSEYSARRSDALSFLGTPHFIEVLPAYLNLLLVLGPRSPVPETLLLILNRPRRVAELEAGLTPGQKRVVGLALARFVEEYPASADPAQVALDRHWNRFLEK